MKKKILIKKEDFKETEDENIDLRKLQNMERVDVTDEGIEITFIWGK